MGLLRRTFHQSSASFHGLLFLDIACARFRVASAVLPRASASAFPRQHHRCFSKRGPAKLDPQLHYALRVNPWPPGPHAHCPSSQTNCPHPSGGNPTDPRLHDKMGHFLRTPRAIQYQRLMLSLRTPAVTVTGRRAAASQARRPP